MPEAVIVAAARTPIGRAFKGSLKDLRPDDLAVAAVRAALDKVPQLDPHDIGDLRRYHDDGRATGAPAGSACHPPQRRAIQMVHVRM